jgi:hypothetical protein
MIRRSASNVPAADRRWEEIHESLAPIRRSRAATAQHDGTANTCPCPMNQTIALD